MDKHTIRALLLAAAVVTPNCVAVAAEQAPVKNAEKFSADELRHTLRALNLYVCESEPVEDGTDEQHKENQ